MLEKNLIPFEDAELLRGYQYYREFYNRFDSKYSINNPGNSFQESRIFSVIENWMRKTGKNLADCTLCDLGCGPGSKFQYFHEMGFSEKNLYGIDFHQESLTKAKKSFPKINFSCGSADSFHFQEKFDFITQFVLFSSILSDDLRIKTTERIKSSLKPGGYFISYDFSVHNWMNPQTRKIDYREWKSLFPDYNILRKEITLFPPLARKIGKISLKGISVLSSIPFLCTHELVIMKKKLC